MDPGKVTGKGVGEGTGMETGADFEFSTAATEALTGVCFCLGVRKAARRVSRLYDEALAPYGLTIGQFGILAHIEADDGQSVQDLADRLDMDQSALSRGIRPIERTGLLISRSDPSDRRRRVLVLSRAGKRRFDEAAQAWQRVQTAIAAQYGRERSAALRRDLQALNEQL